MLRKLDDFDVPLVPVSLCCKSDIIMLGVFYDIDIYKPLIKFEIIYQM